MCRREKDWNQPECLTGVLVQKREYIHTSKSSRVANEEALLSGKAYYKIVYAIRPHYVKTHTQTLSVSRTTF